MLTTGTPVKGRGNGSQQIKSTVLKAPQVGQSVGPCSDGLGFQGGHGPRGRHFRGNNRIEILFQRNVVDYTQTSGEIAEFQPASVGSIFLSRKKVPCTKADGKKQGCALGLLVFNKKRLMRTLQNGLEALSALR